MGNSVNKFLEIPLVPPSLPVAAFDTKYCNATQVTLHFVEIAPFMTTTDFTVRNAFTRQKYLQLDHSRVLWRRGRVLDADGVAVAHFRRSSSSGTGIYAGHDSTNLLFSIKVKRDTKFDCSFRNVVDGNVMRMGIDGNFCDRAAMIWMDRGNGRKLPVARIYKPDHNKLTQIDKYLNFDDYFVDVAPNVDIALVTFLCIALALDEMVEKCSSVLEGLESVFD